MHHLEHCTGPEWHAHAHNHIYIYYIKNDICLLSFIMIFMIKILMLINIYIIYNIIIYIYINQPLAHPNALSRALDGPGVARPRTQPQKRHARVLSTCRDESRDPFALKRCVLETCCTSKLLAERPTSRPPKSFILSVTRVVSGASIHTCTKTLRMLTLAPPKRLPGPLCTQNVLTTYGTSESARISWTSEQPLAHQNASYRALHRS